MSESNIIVESNKMLDGIEGKMRNQAEVFRIAHARLVEEERFLTKIVVGYKNKRRLLQARIWKKEKLGWCQNCNKFYPEKKIILLYTVGNEWNGSHGRETYLSYKRLRSFCNSCADRVMSVPNGGKDEFECSRVKKSKDHFLVLVLGQWIRLTDLDEVIIEIEPKNYESLYNIGKPISFQGLPLIDLRVGKEKII